MIAAPSGVADLSDVDALVASDVAGSLRAVASSGALVRATASAVAEGALDRLREMPVRSVVLAASPGPARYAADLVAAVAAGASTVPVLAVDVVPRWTAALDVVVVLSDDPGDVELAESVVGAARRGTEVVLGVPADGPLAAAGRGDSMRLPPRVAVAQSASLPRFVAVGLAALGTAGALDDADLGSLADVLDGESARDHPATEVFASPAKSLAERMSGRPVVLVGAGAVSTAVARHGAAALLRHAGAAVASGHLAEALSAPSARVGGPAELDATAALFHDPEIDGPSAPPSSRVFVVATAAERERATIRMGALADAELVTVVDEQRDAATVGGTVASSVAETMVLATRLEAAAVYLGLVR